MKFVRKLHRLGIYLFISLFFFSDLASDQWSGIDYALNSQVQQSHAELLLESLSLKGNEKILDIGCGNGKITAQLAQMVSQGLVIGIDPSNSMLEKACENDLANLSFYEGKAENFVTNEEFDHIIAIHVLHWIKEQDKALRNIFF